MIRRHDEETPKRVAVVGLGLMGASFALALAEAGGVELVGIDADSRTRARARELGIFEAVSDSMEAARGVGTIVLAVPISVMRAVLADVVACAGEAVVTDMASTKVSVMAWAQEAGVDLVGGHPMGGRERPGIDSADPSLFQGAPWVLTRSHPEVEALVRAVGAIPVVVDPWTHDRLVAGVSHTAYLVSTAYLLALSDSPDWSAMSALTGPGFRDMTRLAAGDPSLQAAIVETNRVNVTAWLDATMEAMAEMRRQMSSTEGLRATFERARRARHRWQEDGARADRRSP